MSLEHFFKAFANLKKLELDVPDISEVGVTEDGKKQIVSPLRSILIHQSTNSKIAKDFLMEFAYEMKESGQWGAFDRFEFKPGGVLSKQEVEQILIEGITRHGLPLCSWDRRLV